MSTKTTKHIVVHNGQHVDLDPEVAGDDELVLRLLSTWIPDARSGSLERSEPDEHGVVTLTLATRARPKGIDVIESGALAELAAAAAGENPVLTLYRDLEQLYKEDTPGEAFVSKAKIEKALVEGKDEQEALLAIRARLAAAPTAEAQRPPPNWG